MSRPLEAHQARPSSARNRYCTRSRRPATPTEARKVSAVQVPPSPLHAPSASAMRTLCTIGDGRCAFRSASSAQSLVTPPPQFRRDVQGGGAPMRRQLSWMIGVVILACAGGQSGGTGAAATERQRVQNLVPFDIGTCFPSKLDLGKTANEYTLQAAFRGARPAINECLADGKGQNAKSPTKGTATITLDGSGTNVTIAGEGLQPAASACIEKAIRTQLGGVTAPAGGKPLTLEGPLERDPNNMIRMGLNEASDIQGTIRLALPQWCSCFEPVKNQAPPELAGSVTLTREDVAKYADRMPSKDGGTVSSKGVSAALQPSDPSGAQVASCVGQRIESLPLKSANEQFIVPAQLFLLNSQGSSTMPANTPPQLQFAQMDVVREQRQAEAYAALARRQNVANAYDAQVQAYQAAAASKDSKKRKAAAAW